MNWFKYLLWVIITTSWVTLCFILPDFIDNPITGIRTAVTLCAYLAALSIASFWIVYLVGLNRHVAWVGLMLLGISGAAVSYFRVAFHATVTPMIVDATLHTNGGTIAGVISWQLVVWIAVNLLFAFGLMRWRQHIETPSKAWLHALIATGCLVLYYNADSRLHMSINQRYPYNVVHSITEYIRQQKQISTARETLPYMITQVPDSLDVIFVLGEAVRADHVQLNGYPRETMPLLAARSNVVSFTNIYSEHTYTTTSVPCILSPADSLHPDLFTTHTSFIHTMSECGFQSAWISNQDNGRTYVSFIHEADTVIFPNAGKSVFVFNPWYDEQLLPPLDSVAKAKHPKRLYVLHTIGSHWYYNNHVPPQQQFFAPCTTNRIVTNNTDEQIVNSYDNTIRYADLFLDSLIQRFENRTAILIYLSDHGEALGEDGRYLHAGDVEALHHPACIIWYSDTYATFFPEKVRALETNKNKRYRTDFLYYSILSAVGIESEGHNQTVDIFAQ